MVVQRLRSFIAFLLSFHKALAFILLSGVLAVLFCGGCTSDLSPGQTLRLEEGTNMAAALSPDGRTIVFDVLGQLWMIPLAGGKAIPITDQYGNARQPSWAPDGNQLTFQAYWEGNWHIYTVKRDGTGLKRITDALYDHREPHWSPDGRYIIYSADDQGTYDIYQYDLDSLEEVRVTTSPANEYGPVWSPEGERIAYLSDNPDEKGARVLNLVDSSDKIIYKTENTPHGLSWNKDGSGITLVEQSFGKSQLIYSPVETLEAEPTTLSLDTEDVFPFRTSWLDENTYIYTSNGRIQRKMLGAENPSAIPMELEVVLNRKKYPPRSRNFDAQQGLPVKGLTWPDLSPDGMEVALIMMGDLYRASEDGVIEQLTNDRFLELTPEWSPDQGKIAYVSDRTGGFGVYLRDLKTGRDELVSLLESAPAGLAWSPDGSKLAFTISFGPRLGRASYINLETKEIVHVSPMITSSLGAPTWSPDSKILAFTRLQAYSSLYREGVNGVVKYMLDGTLLGGIGDINQMSIGTRGKDGPVWSPDGMFMATISAGQLMLIPMDGNGRISGNPEIVTPELADSPSWGSDSKNLLYISTDRLKKINIETGETFEFSINKTWNRVVPEGRLGIHAGTLFDAVSDQLQSDMDIIIKGNRIEAIISHDDANQGRADRWIDASKQFVMPGLIESHTHQGSWGGEKLGRAWLAWGITSTRNPASDPYDELNRKEGTESGHLTGPRIFFTGSPIDGNRIYYGGASALAGEEQIKKELDRASALDYDLIKTYVRLSDPLQEQVIERAHEIGLPVSSHELFPAVGYGIDGVEHIKGTSRRGFSPKMSHLNRAYEDVITLIAESGMSFTPTTGIYTSFNYLIAKNESVLDDDRIKMFVDPFAIAGIKSGVTQIRENAHEWDIHFNHTMAMVTNIYNAGGLIIAGTDSPIIPYGFSLHIEMEAYALGGIPNFDVLKTATDNAARALNAQNDVGTIAKGKLADILILDGNPVNDIRDTRKVSQVIINGVIHSKESLFTVE